MCDLRKSAEGTCTAQKTVFDWIISGSASMTPIRYEQGSRVTLHHRVRHQYFTTQILGE